MKPRQEKSCRGFCISTGFVCLKLKATHRTRLKRLFENQLHRECTPYGNTEAPMVAERAAHRIVIPVTVTNEGSDLAYRMARKYRYVIIGVLPRLIVERGTGSALYSVIGVLALKGFENKFAATYGIHVMVFFAFYLKQLNGVFKVYGCRETIGDIITQTVSYLHMSLTFSAES